MATARPKLAFKGKTRKQIKELLNFIGQIQRMDVAIAAKATALGVPAVTFHMAGNVNLSGPLQTIADRCTAALVQKVSAQAVPGQQG